MYKNKQDEHSIITRNESRFIVQGYNQEEKIDYDETFAPVSRMKATRIFISFAAYRGFKLFRINVKSFFLNDYQKKEVYVKKTLGFEDIDLPYHVLKLDKVLYRLK